MPRYAPNTPNGTPNNTANGMDQLSYCAASTRNTMMMPNASTSPPPVDVLSWYDSPLSAAPTPSAAYLLCTNWSIAASISPELLPGPGDAVIKADVNPLNRVTTFGPLRNFTVVSDDTGINCDPVPRTYRPPMSWGCCRYGSCAWTCTRYVLPYRLKSFTYSVPSNDCNVWNRSVSDTPSDLALARSTSTYSCGTLTRIDARACCTADSLLASLAN